MFLLFISYVCNLATFSLVHHMNASLMGSQRDGSISEEQHSIRENETGICRSRFLPCLTSWIPLICSHITHSVILRLREGDLIYLSTLPRLHARQSNLRLDSLDLI